LVAIFAEEVARVEVAFAGNSTPIRERSSKS
jgi:hypothetical protein